MLSISDRYYWDKYDPYVISESLFAFGNVLSVCRMAGLLIVSERIGPMIISLAGMAYVRQQIPTLYHYSNKL